MFQFKRNQIIVTVLVFMIAIAAYLGLSEDPNTVVSPDMVMAGQWDDQNVDVETMNPDDNFFDQFATMETLPPDGDDMEMTTPDQEVAVIGEEADAEPLVADEKAPSNQVVITKKAENKVAETSSGDIVTDRTVDVTYFAEERMLREQSRAAQMEQLSECAANESMDQEARSKAAQSLIEIQDRIEKETSSESLLRAKGFKDVFVRMDKDTVDVVVNSDKLSDEQVAQIEEIVHRKTGYTMGQIKISCLKVNAEPDNK
ncbi:MAG: SpoIIIAH-like family protein [Cellulosilyticaceae bacterium]